MDMNPLWAWVLLLFFWCVIFMLVSIGLSDAFPFMKDVSVLIFCCLMLVIVTAAILGSVQWLEYNQAWPFNPQ